MTTLQIVVGSISGILLIYVLYGIFKELASEEGVEAAGRGGSIARAPGRPATSPRPGRRRGRPRRKSRRS